MSRYPIIKTRKLTETTQSLMLQEKMRILWRSSAIMKMSTIILLIPRQTLMWISRKLYLIRATVPECKVQKSKNKLILLLIQADTPRRVSTTNHPHLWLQPWDRKTSWIQWMPIFHSLLYNHLQETPWQTIMKRMTIILDGSTITICPKMNSRMTIPRMLTYFSRILNRSSMSRTIWKTANLNQMSISYNSNQTILKIS